MTRHFASQRGLGRIDRVSEPTIREARADELKAIIDFWATVERHTGLPDRIEYLQTLQEFAPDLLLVAELDGRLVGTVIGGWDGWRAQIARLTTDEAVRRQGIARALVHEVERRLYRRGARRIYALVDRDNAPGMAFWEASGYTTNYQNVQYSRNLDSAP
jgi:ribosomal protein S18 acetylase RimI-like enzyme